MNETKEIELKEIFSVLKGKMWMVAICAILVAALVFMYTAIFVTPMYTAQISVYVNNRTVNSNNSGIASGDLAVALQLVNTYIHILQDDAVLEQVIEKANLNYTAAQLKNMITAEVVEETEVFRVSVSSSDPALSARIANTIAEVAPGAISNIIEGSNAKVFSPAKVPTKASSPNYMINTLIGALAGAILAVVGIILYNMLDVRVKGETDLQKICPIPVLGMIPDLTDEALNGKKRMPLTKVMKGGRR